MTINLKNYEQYCENWQAWADKQCVYPQPPADTQLDQQTEDAETTILDLYGVAA